MGHRSLLLLTWVALCTGAYPLAGRDILALVFGRPSGSPPASAEAAQVLFAIRLPRVFAAMLVGGAGRCRCGVSKPVSQSFGVAGYPGAYPAVRRWAQCWRFSLLPLLAIQGFAFAGGLIAVALVYAIGSAVQSDPILALILTGVVVGTLFGAGIATLKYLADPFYQLPAITFWLLGSLCRHFAIGSRDRDPLMVIGLVPHHPAALADKRARPFR